MADRIEQAAPDVRALIQTMHSTASGLEHASRMIDAGEIPQSSAILNCAAHCRQAAAAITHLQAELAEAREVPGRIVADLQNKITAWKTSAEAQGKPVGRHVVGVTYAIKAIEARDWSKP